VEQGKRWSRSGISGSGRGDAIRPASPVNVFGRLARDPLIFREVDAGTSVRVERAGAN